MSRRQAWAAVLCAFLGATASPVFGAPRQIRAIPAAPLAAVAPVLTPPSIPLIASPAALRTVLSAPGILTLALETTPSAEHLPLESVSAAVFDGRAAPPRGADGPIGPAASAAAQVPGTEGLSGAPLFRALHDITGRGYRAHGYSEARRYMFGTSDQVVVDGKAGLVDAYSGVFVPGRSDQGEEYPERGDQNGDGWVDGQGMNAEHIWPQSFFHKRLPMRSDLHQLLPTFMHSNSMRGTLPFGEVRGRGEYSNDAGAKVGQGVFEPPNAVKGRVARAMLYFYTRYHDRNISNGSFSEAFWNNKLELLLRWNRQFPPSGQERRRNDLVARFQGNRNPFVDDPGLADRIGAAALRRERQGRPGRARSRGPRGRR